MRNFDAHYGHADRVNRLARAGIALLLLVGAGLVWSALDGPELETPDDGSFVATVITSPVSVLGSTLTTPPAVGRGSAAVVEQRPAALEQPTRTTVAVTTTSSPPGASTTTTGTPVSTTVLPATTTTSPPTTTSLPPTTTTTLPPPTTTTTTAVPPTTPTLPPAPTPTTVAPDGWFPVLTASASCNDDQPVIRWSAGDPADDWSNGWQMVIDSDSRGLYAPGTIVTNEGGPAIRLEEVEPGRQTLTVDVHWERLLQGDRDRGFGSFSVSVTAGEC